MRRASAMPSQHLRWAGGVMPPSIRHPASSSWWVAWSTATGWRPAGSPSSWIPWGAAGGEFGCGWVTICWRWPREWAEVEVSTARSRTGQPDRRSPLQLRRSTQATVPACRDGHRPRPMSSRASCCLPCYGSVRGRRGWRVMPFIPLQARHLVDHLQLVVEPVADGTPAGFNPTATPSSSNPPTPACWTDSTGRALPADRDQSTPAAPERHRRT